MMPFWGIFDDQAIKQNVMYQAKTLSVLSSIESQQLWKSAAQCGHLSSKSKLPTVPLNLQTKVLQCRKYCVYLCISCVLLYV